MSHNCLLFDLSGVYGEQYFWKNDGFTVLSLTTLQGTNCCCDEDAEMVMDRMIRENTGSRIHFLDSGNYHYLSYLFLRHIEEPFQLIVFDHHTDLTESAFGGLLSCSSWLRRALLEYPMLRGVTLYGPEPDDFEKNGRDFKDRIAYFPEEQLFNPAQVLKTDLPVYISVDKDILEKSEVNTSWSQGSLSASELEQLLDAALLYVKRQNIPLLGFDICGERDIHDQTGDSQRSEEINRRILSILDKYEK